MWTTIIQIIIGIIALGILVFVHELGHFLVGRALGFKILEFGLGFGPKLVKIRRKGILYSIGIFPLGGFVRFYGEDDDTEDEGAMNSMPKWKRFLVLVAGSGSNIIFGFIVGVILLMSVGNISEEPVITKVVQQSPAYVAGVQEKDRIHSVDGVKADVDNFVILIENAPQNFDMAVIRDEQIVNILL